MLLNPGSALCAAVTGTDSRLPRWRVTTTADGGS